MSLNVIKSKQNQNRTELNLNQMLNSIQIRINYTLNSKNHRSTTIYRNSKNHSSTTIYLNSKTIVNAINVVLSYRKRMPFKLL